MHAPCSLRWVLPLREPSAPVRLIKPSHAGGKFSFDAHFLDVKGDVQDVYPNVHEVEVRG